MPLYMEVDELAQLRHQEIMEESRQSAKQQRSKKFIRGAVAEAQQKDNDDAHFFDAVNQISNSDVPHLMPRIEEESRSVDSGAVPQNEYYMRRLTQIFRSQENKKRWGYLMRAFHKWYHEFPLYQKCDELAKQIRERTFLLDTVRSSYLRDVVSVKNCLVHISKFELDNRSSSELAGHLQQMKDGLYDLHTVPSLDLRELVSRAKNIASATSKELMENLIDAGIVDEFANRGLNPWEESRGYQRVMRIRRGPSYNFPDAGGESYSLFAPSFKKLFVRHCRECTGLALIVKSWNLDIEDAFRFRADFHQIDSVVREMRDLIDRLQGVVAGQEREILDLKADNSYLHTANSWFDKWTKKTDFEAEVDAFEQRDLYRHLFEMAQADRESTAFNAQLRMEKRLEAFVLKERANAKVKQKADEEARLRLKLHEELHHLQQLLCERDDELQFLRRTRDNAAEERAVLERKVAKLEQEHRLLQDLVGKKSDEFAEMREKLQRKIDNLHKQLDQLNAEYLTKENQVQDLREQLRAGKVSVDASCISSIAAHFTRFMRR